MTQFISAFDVEAAEQHDERKAARHAAVLFSKRASAQFETFLRQAATKDEFDARVSMIGDDLAQLASDIRMEHGGVALLLENAFIERIAGGAFCDDCRKWKSGPKAGTCECGDGESKDSGEDLLEDAPSAVGEKTAAEDNLGGKGKASPEMDKSEWTTLDAIDTDGGPYKTVSQDVSDVADHEKDFLAQTDAVAEHNVDVTKGTDTSGETGPATDTWSGTAGQANPVTSGFLTADALHQAIATYEG